MSAVSSSNDADPHPAPRLRMGGLARWSSIDFPGKLAAVVFCQGCPWRCSYCHNPQLLDARVESRLEWEEVLAFLRTRRGLLDAVVFSGGEPLLQAGLPPAIAAVRALGFEVGLHTGGMYPERLAAVLPALDWVALDIKAPWHRLDGLTASHGGAARVTDSLLQLLASRVAYECRTTWSPALFPLEELHALSGELAALGVTQWALQQCRGALAGTPPWPGDLALFAARFERFEFRPA